MNALLVCVAALGLIGSGIATAAGPPAVPDAEVERNIRQRFAKSKIASNAFRVRVLGGVATIDGKTEVVQHKGVATRLARLGGAKSVDNRIEIGEAARAKARASLATGKRQARSIQPRSQRQQALPAPQTTPRRAVVRWPSTR